MTGIGHNGMTRDEWLHVILNSGEVTRIAQHLALVIYHLSDPTTNRAKMSARDLERITGWGRTSIIEHLDEIDLYIRVRWGQGRAKALFELQGVIAEAVVPLRVINGADTRTLSNSCVREADTTVDTTVDTTISVRLVDTTVDTTVDTNSCGEPDGHKNVVQLPVVSATWTQRGVRGEDSLSPKIPPNSASALVRETNETPPPFLLHPDGSFSGTAFEHFTTTEVAAFRSIYSFLEFPAELVAADQMFAVEFDRDQTPFGSPARLARLNQYLASRNAKASAAVRAAQEALRAKQSLRDDSCWFDEDRLMVAGQFRAELLEMVDGSEQRLRLTLDKAAASVPIDLRGAALRKTVRGQFARHVEWSRNDERKVAAVERRVGNGGTAPPPVETKAERYARILGEEPDKPKGGRW